MWLPWMIAIKCAREYAYGVRGSIKGTGFEYLAHSVFSLPGNLISSNIPKSLDYSQNGEHIFHDSLSVLETPIS